MFCVYVNHLVKYGGFMFRWVCGYVCVYVSNLTAGDSEEAVHHIINIIVLQVRVISDWWVMTELVPAEAFRGVVTVGKDPC